MGRSPCCDKLGLKKGPWTPEEDQKLLAYIEEHGHGNWRALPSKAGLQRCGKSCRLRWTNYLRPDIKRGKFSLQEEQTIIQLHALLGNRWSAIATHLPKRTDNEIKNYWNTHLKKRLTKMGIDPVTHKPKNDALLSAADGGQQSKNAANLSHMAQWESARLEAEARLVRQSKLGLSSSNNSPNNASSFTSPSPDLHINNDHHYLTMTTNAAATTSTSTTPRCLDVLKAWHVGWPSTSSTSTNANNDNGIIGISMGSIGIGGGVGVGVGVGVGIESPTSTLSFSENNAPPVVPNMGTGTVIEFMGHHHHHGHEEDHHQDMVIKEEGDHHHRHNQHQHHHQEHEWSSLSFMPSSAGFDDISALSINHHGTDNTIRERDGEVEDDEDHDKNHDDYDDHNQQDFMEGFTELLLSTKTSVSGGEKSVGEEREDDESNNTTTNNNNNNNKNNNNNENSSGSNRGGTSTSRGSDYYEDNKTYWNSILHLVNSSPSHSPMF